MTFDPSSLAGKVLWLRGKDLGANGTTVASWADQSGAGHNATSGHDLPTVAAASTPSGGASLALSHSRLDIPNLGLTGAGEMWMVLKNTDSNGSDANACTWKFGADNSSARNNYFPYAGVVYDDFGTDTRRQFTPSLSLASWRLYRVSITNGGSGTGTWLAQLDNTTQLTVAGANIAWLSATTPHLSGDYNNSSGQGFVGNYAEILVRSQVSTGSEIANLITYFNTQHGLSVPGGAPATAPAFRGWGVGI